MENLSQNLEQVESQLSRSQREVAQLDNLLHEAQVCLVGECGFLFFVANAVIATSCFNLIAKLGKTGVSYKKQRSS